MNERKPPPPSDAAWGPSPWLLALVLALVLVLVTGGIALAWRAGDAAPPLTVAAATASAPQGLNLPAAPERPAEPASQAGTAAASLPRASTPAAPQRIPRLRDPGGDLTPDLADYVNEGERPTMAEVIDRLHAAGVRTGLGAFSPPGTRPPLIGLAVPETFDLPPGYVRHHQATDDGQRIEPILMFSPDAQTVVVNGRSVAVPADRVVPPELAPAGLPLRRIVVPAPVDAPR